MAKTPKAAPKPVEATKPVAEKKAETKARFEEADAKGEPTQEDIDAATLSRSIRGW